MAAGNITLTGAVTGGPTGSRTFGPLTIMLSAAVDATQVLSFGVGANTVTVPTGSTLCIIAGPNVGQATATNATVLTLKGVTGDTGVPISAKYPHLVCWDAAPATFVVNATVACAVEVFFA